MSTPMASFTGKPALRQWSLRTASAAVLCASMMCLAASAQEKKADEKAKIPPPEDVNLQTGDGVQLVLTYFPGSKGKESVPIVLLHMWKHSGNDYHDLALYLQSRGYAVIVPDLRGHGRSAAPRVGARSELFDAATQAATLGPQQFAMMVTGDMEAIREFLREKNNAGELNMNKLCLVGAEMGAAVALGFTANDWSIPDVGAYQMGRFVKALVLISPKETFRGLNIKTALAHPAVRSQIPLLLLVGVENPQSAAEAKRLYDIFARYHPDQGRDTKIDKKTLFFGRLQTKRQGTDMLEEKGLDVDKKIAEFVRLRLVASEEAKEWTWQIFKKNPYE